MDKNDEDDTAPRLFSGLRDRFQHAEYLSVNSASFRTAWFEGGSIDASGTHARSLI